MIARIHLLSMCRKFQNMEELIIDYESGALDAAEVRLALAEALNKILKVIFSSYIHPLISPEGKTRPILLVEITRKNVNSGAT
jgi:hypothetical protein